MGPLVSPSQPKMAHFLFAVTHTQATSFRHRFLFFLLPLPPPFIFKENSRLAEGAQLRRSLAAQRAQQGAGGLLNPFPEKAVRPMSKFSNY